MASPTGLSPPTSPGPVAEAFGHVVFTFTKMQPLLPTYLHLLLSAILPIFTASHAALTRPSSAAPPEEPEDSDEEDDGPDEIVQKIENLTPSDAILFPLLAGLTLTSLYLLIKWLQDPAMLNFILGLYFSAVGLVFGVKFMKDTLALVRSVFLPVQYSAGGRVWRADETNRCFIVAAGNAEGPNASSTRQTSPLPGPFHVIPLPKWLTTCLWKTRRAVYARSQLIFHVHRVVTIKAPLTALDLVSLVGSSLLVAYHTFISKPWFLTNFLGFSFCYGSLQYMTPTTAWTGTLLLGALFLYDIYFVFFTPMMVTVATKLDVPIKLLFPQPNGCVFPVGAPEGSATMEEYLDCLAKKRAMAMLGLGDIVIPGMMLALALRFDLYLFYRRRKRNSLIEYDDKNKGKIEKLKYLPATGGWGERLWTRRLYYDARLRAKEFPKPYFYAGIIGYLLGMVATILVMQIYEHAQPALLYLVPGVVISLWGTAIVNGDLKLLWEYTEAREEENNRGENEEKRLDDREDLQANGHVTHTPIHSNQTITEAKAEIQRTRSLLDNAMRSEEDSMKSPETAGQTRFRSESVKTQSGDKSKDSTDAFAEKLFYISITLPTVRGASFGPLHSEETEEEDEEEEGSRSTSSSGDGRPDTRRAPPLASGTVEDGNGRVAREILPDIEADHAVLEKLAREIIGTHGRDTAGRRHGRAHLDQDGGTVDAGQPPGRGDGRFDYLLRPVPASRLPPPSSESFYLPHGPFCPPSFCPPS